VDFEFRLIDQILNFFPGFLVFLNYFLIVLVQISQILVNFFTGHWFALCEVEILDFELTSIAANQIDVLLAEHNLLSMFSAGNFFLFIGLFLGSVYFFHHFHHFLVRLQLAYFDVGLFFARGTFGHFIF
jgi:uncharacterized membrane protein YccF (DUF307 family)